MNFANNFYNNTGRTTITGALIASHQPGNLTLNTQDLVYSDLNDFYKTESKGFGFSTGGGTTADSGKSNLAPKGSTTISAKSTGAAREQLTKATIGNGTIIVAGKTLESDNTQINRDVNNSQVITQDMIIGALDGTMTLDNRLLTSQGRENIKNDFKNLRANLAKTAVGITNTVKNPFMTAYQVATNNKINITEALDQWKGNATAGVNIIRMDRKVINNLSEGKDIKEIQQAVNNEQVKIYYNENDTDQEGNKIAGKHDNDHKGDIYLNAANDVATNTEKFVNTYGHESAHPFTANEDIANNSGNYARNMLGLLNILNGDAINTAGKATTQSWLTQQENSLDNMSVLLNNTIKANAVKNQSNRVEQAARDLKDENRLKDAFKSVGTHTFIIATPDNPGNFSIQKLIADGINSTAVEPTKRIIFEDLGNGRLALIMGAYENEKN